jgi:general secretion pathway protein J
MTGLSHPRGFTLLELLVAMAIFAIVGVMAMVGLNTVIGQQSLSRASLDRLHEVQRAVRLLTGDLGQAAPRYVRDILGEKPEDPFMAGGSVEYLVRFTREGWQNPQFVARGTLQRVQYRFEDGKLIREYWPVVDRTSNTEIQSEVILEKVESVKFEFRDRSSPDLHADWPITRTSATATAQPQTLPTAVRITLRLKDWGEIQRLVEVPG